MLADTVDIENVDGTHTYSLNGDPGGTAFSPLRDFDVTLDDRATQARYKQQASGTWPTRSYEGQMTIHIEGSLFGSTSENYWTARTALLKACRGLPGANITQTKRGTLYVTPQGATERWLADYQGFTDSLPIVSNMGTGSDMLLTFVCGTPWFIGETSGDFFWWS
jgi:hypothetical protein